MLFSYTAFIQNCKSICLENCKNIVWEILFATFTINKIEGICLKNCKNSCWKISLASYKYFPKNLWFEELQFTLHIHTLHVFSSKRMCWFRWNMSPQFGKRNVSKKHQLFSKEIELSGWYILPLKTDPCAYYWRSFFFFLTILILNVGFGWSSLFLIFFDILVPVPHSGQQT